MAHPVQNGQNISLPGLNPSAGFPTRRSVPVIQDTLILNAQAQNSTFFGKAWDAIANFFKSIFGGFFKSEPAPASTADVKARIQQIAARDHFVWFYKQQENPLTAFMGNFHPCAINLWGLQFKCAEAAYQAAKFHPNRTQMQQFQNLDGEGAWQLGNQLSRGWNTQQKANWLQHNRNIMLDVVHAKFNQNPDLKDLLLATDYAYLVEHIPVKGRDAFWGDDHDGTGQNMLGQVVMGVRERLGGIGVVQRNPDYNQFVSRR